MRYKLIISDFDGTLCRSDNTVSQYSREVIAEYFARGGIFTLSSGRNIASLRRRLVEAGIENRDVPLISLQGSVIEDNLTRKPLGKVLLDRQQALWFSAECAARGLYHHVYTDEGIYSSRPNDYTELYIKLAGVDMEFVGDLTRFIDEHKELNYVKLLAVAENGMNVKYADILKQQADGGVNIFTSGQYFFECISSAAGKGNGLLRVADMLGIDPDHTLAFGDEMNDLSMLEVAGLGVAVANARQNLKDRADAITLSNDEDGVAKAIEKYCL